VAVQIVWYCSCYLKVVPYSLFAAVNWVSPGFQCMCFGAHYQRCVCESDLLTIHHMDVQAASARPQRAATARVTAGGRPAAAAGAPRSRNPKR
jgi:hypothetical protein